MKLVGLWNRITNIFVIVGVSLIVKRVYLVLLASFIVTILTGTFYVNLSEPRADVPNEHAAVELIKTCKGLDNQRQCWEEIISLSLEKLGLDTTFEVFGLLYSSEPIFAAACHDFAHLLGTYAYEEYAKGEDFGLSTKTSYCGYGFYHGFMENLLINTGDPKKAVAFCEFVGEKLRGQNNDAYGACFHGIGHGSVDGSDPRAWGDPEKVVKPGLDLCEKIVGDRREPFGELYRCITGAYNSLEVISATPKYKLTTFRRNPFPFCAKQIPAYQEGCYTNMIPALFWNYQNDFEKIAKIIEGIPEEKDAYTIRSMVISSLFHEYYRVNLDKEDYVETGVDLCRNLSARSHLPCVEGLSGGLMKYGEPGKEYVEALEFCADSVLSSAEKDTCYNRTLSTLPIWYSREKVKEICSQAPKGYQKYCEI